MTVSDKDLKEWAVRLATTLGLSKAEAARRNKVGASTYVRWSKGTDMDSPFTPQTRLNVEGFIWDVAQLEPSNLREKRAQAMAASMLERLEAALDEASPAVPRSTGDEDESLATDAAAEADRLEARETRARARKRRGGGKAAGGSA